MLATLQKSKIMFLKNCIRRGEDREMKKRQSINSNSNAEGEADKYENSLCINAKKRQKINILRTLKFADCIDMIQAYMITYTDIKNN